jgi:hypothetical protein
MKAPACNPEEGNLVLIILCTILIVSIIGGSVLLNCATRLNVTSSQVRAWKEALGAAEAGGDIGYAEVRKTILDKSHAFSGWTHAGGVYTSPTATFGGHSLTSSSTIDIFYSDGSGNPWYRLRAKGVAPVLGLKRVGMDDRMAPGTRGDSLLRTIDFNYDHFTAAYGPNGNGSGQALVAVNQPQVARRIELIAAPMTPFEAAIKAGGTFYGLGSAAYVDSFRSSAGAYDPSVKDSPNDPRYADARSGTIEINTSVATIMGNIYGSVYTNGGVVTKNTTSISGVIDNNVPFTLPPFVMPDTSTWTYVANPNQVAGNTTITPPTAGSASQPNYYILSSFANNGNLSVNPNTVNGVVQETYVALHVTSDIGNGTGNGPSITIPAHVHLQLYFDGNFQTKAASVVNGSGLAGNLQFYGISPTDPNVQQTINLNSGSGSSAGFAAVFYAPSANVTVNGGPDITGAVVCKNFYANGNVHWHYDRALDIQGDAVDYRVASYVEDTR